MARKQPRRAEAASVSPTEAYWVEARQTLGRDVFFIDTGAILKSFEENDQVYSEFFETTIGTFVTSSYTIVETVRRLVKDRHRQFIGPGGERSVDLALYLLRRWVQAYEVQVMHLPEAVYQEALDVFEEKRYLACDLNDILSAQIVKGLEQTRIVTSDRRHFPQLGLDCLPTGA